MAARAFIGLHAPEWQNRKHRQQWEHTLATYADPVIGALPVQDITREHILKILRPIWARKTETATRLRGRIEQILDAEAVLGHRGPANPAR